MQRVVIPIIGGLLAVPFLDLGKTERVIRQTFNGFPVQVDTLRPLARSDWASALRGAGFSTRFPLGFLDPLLPSPLDRVSNYQYLVPMPVTLFTPLPESRVRTYVSRFLDRRNPDGYWIFHDRNKGNPVLSWVEDEIRQRASVIRQWTANGFTVYQFQSVPDQNTPLARLKIGG